MNALKFVLMAVCFVSCGSSNNICNPREAKRVMENFAREYTGLDTLIRVDGYYYCEDSTGLSTPFMVSNNGEFQILYVLYKNHNRIQEGFRNDKFDKSGRGKGNYTMSGDTIKVRWAMSFQYSCYDIFSQQYLILNDTTLRRIWSLCETCNSSDGKNPIKNEIYKFYKYPVDTK